MKRLLTAVLAAVASAVTLGAATPAAAAPATGWYMLVNDSYGRCLSTNAQTSPSGSGTHMVYLAACNANTPGQWWRLSGGGDSQSWNFTNYQNFGNEVWELSTNANTPSGGAAGTNGVYTAAKSLARGHDWQIIDFTELHKVRFQSWLTGNMMSATHNNPYSGGTYRVYTAAWQEPAPPAHLWRFWAHPSGRPSCSPCGAY